ncbi:MAG: hypothetical protein ACPG19_03130 [Saprospiraceae bacterium]
MPNPKVIIKKIETEQERQISQIMESAMFEKSNRVDMFEDSNAVHVIVITSYDEAIGLGSIFFKNKKTIFRIGVVRGFDNLGYEKLIENYLKMLTNE